MEFEVKEELVERIRDGDEEAFEEFAKLVTPKLYGAAFRMLRDHDASEEVVQMTLIRFLENSHRIKPKSVWGWLYRVLSNLITDEFRRASKKAELKEEILKSASEDPQDALCREDQKRILHAALGALGKKSRAVVLMRMDGFSYAEIAQQLGISEGSARVLFLKSIRKLSREMGAA